MGKKIRCGICRKKITMTYIECRCGGFYCGKHIDAVEHSCKFDHKKMNRDLIRAKNPIVIKEKFEKI